MSWRYRLDEAVEISAPELIGVDFKNEWITIRHGRLRIERDYAFDGCSPAWRLPGGLWLGTPDGPLGADGRPVSWRASLAHDALCQFRTDIPGLRKAATVALFRRMLAEDGAPGWMVRIYPAAVDCFGPQAWRGDDAATQTQEGAQGNG